MRYYYDGQMPIEEDFTRKVGGVDTADLTRHGLGARGVDYVRVQRKSGSGSWTDHASGWPVYDPHGNNVGMLTLSGSAYAIGDERTYDAWGAVRTTSGSPPQQGYCANLGHRSDGESSLVYMRARYYEASTGRFLSEDPARDGGNWYVYCRNQPIRFVDPTGRTSTAFWLGFGSSLAGFGLAWMWLGTLGLALSSDAISQEIAWAVVAEGAIMTTLGMTIATGSFDYLGFIADQAVGYLVQRMHLRHFAFVTANMSKGVAVSIVLNNFMYSMLIVSILASMIVEESLS